MLRLFLALGLVAAAAAGCSPAGKYDCVDGQVAVCNWGKWTKYPKCGAGNVCKVIGHGAYCVRGTSTGGGTEPGTDKPATDKPATDKPATDKPATDKPDQTTGTDKPSSGDKLVSYEDFKAGVTSCGYPEPSKEKYNNAVGLAKKDGDISTKREFAMFLTEILWESDGLRATSEYRCKTNQCAGEYVWAQCPVKDPNKHYFGRGYIQLTWCYNYQSASKDLFGDDRLVQNPEKVNKHYFGRGYIQLTWCYNYQSASKDLFGDDRLVQNPEKVNKHYFGRGYIQLTWCYNYQSASKDLFGDDRLVQNPETTLASYVGLVQTAKIDSFFGFCTVLRQNAPLYTTMHHFAPLCTTLMVHSGALWCKSRRGFWNRLVHNGALWCKVVQSGAGW